MAPDSISVLKKVPLFKSVSQDELDLIRHQFEDVSFPAGEVIIHEGELGDSLYIIKSGKLSVVADLEENALVLSYLTEGDYFGEMALITGEPRSASVVAETPVELLELSKKNFDSLILSNPGITLTLTHILSHRLKISNRVRESSERFYKDLLAPTGSLKQTGLIELLKFAEQNSLSGKIIIVNENKRAFFYYEKGQLINLQYEQKNEDEALDEIMDWQNGRFVIEPSLFNLADGLSKGNPSQFLRDVISSSYYESFLVEKFTDFIRLVGARVAQTAINKAYYNFEGFFRSAAEFQIKTFPELEVKILAVNGWSEKHSLFMAVLLRDVLKSLERDLFGTLLWEIRSNDEQINAELEKIMFFEYFDQALDFVNG